VGNGKSHDVGSASRHDGMNDVAAALLSDEAAAFTAWQVHLDEEGNAADLALFRRSYVGHYASIDGYADHLIDTYQLDAKLDAAIAPPFRAHVDIDVPGLARALRAAGTLFALPAEPIGVWVFRTDPDSH
jgi:hypothetical protein